MLSKWFTEDVAKKLDHTESKKAERRISTGHGRRRVIILLDHMLNLNRKVLSHPAFDYNLFRPVDDTTWHLAISKKLKVSKNLSMILSRRIPVTFYYYGIRIPLLAQGQRRRIFPRSYYNFLFFLHFTAYNPIQCIP